MLDRRDRRAPLDRATDRVGAAQDVDREPPLLELVRRSAPCEARAPLTPGHSDQAEARQKWLEARAVGHVHLHTIAEPAGPLVKGGCEARGAEVDARKPEGVQRVGVAVAVEVGRADPLERARRPTPLREIGTLDETPARVHARCRAWACWARAPPRAVPCS